MTVRVRIAPSPTGEPHIGTAHTALFNWLFARHHGGSFVVRIEDTDRTRLVPGAVESIKHMLRWLGLDPEEGPGAGGEHGPYFQSERLDLYHREMETLLVNGSAYRCYCSSERLAAVNADKAKNKQPPGYDRHCRFLSAEERAVVEASGVKPVVRLAVPLDGSTTFHDAIRGDITHANATLQDAVLLKSDGYPTYHLAVVVDDHYMHITHVLRGDEWLPSTPLHVLLFAAFGWEPPTFAHLPLILGKDKSKLSKRHGDTSFNAFVEQGYLPDALLNYLGLLGWALDDKTEIISREQFIEHFDIPGIVKSPAVFDFDKLRWLNGIYIRMLPPERFATLVGEWCERGLPAELAELVTHDLAARIGPLIQERIKLLSEIPAMVAFYVVEDDLDYGRETLLGKPFAAAPDSATYALEEACAELEDVEDWEHPTILETLQKLAERREMKFRDLAALVRVAITGSQQSPPLTESMEILGKRESLKRLGSAVDRLRP